MKSKLTLLLLSAALTFAGCTKTDWQELFNGKDFTGFVQRGGEAKYIVEDGVMVGISTPGTPNSFMCTTEEYSDFILEFDVKVDTLLNSGVQVRSHSSENDGKVLVYGYQIEIDPTDRGWSGGIYDEARRGWLYPVTPNNQAAVKSFDSHGWNSYHVEAIGNRIRTWINDVPVADLVDDADASGFIGFQVHAVRDDLAGTRVMWKNIRIVTENLDKYKNADSVAIYQANFIPNTLTDREVIDGWKLLFDGSTSAGWRGAHKDAFPEAGWVIENGCLKVLASGGAESKGGGDIVTVDQYGNFDLSFEFMITEGANSGVKYFVTENYATTGSAIGLEYQILDDQRHPDAKMGRDGNRTVSSLYDLIPAANKRFNGVGQWNAAHIVSINGHVEHWLNGFKVLEYERGSEAYRQLVKESKYKDFPGFGEAEQGHILLQDHGNEVWFRSIKIRE
ncbi:MAG: DUF1080 domain-containing protein [Bacteroidales bacterium]|jgi:hypothetical protein|nr:DUF1080 domain-containing protein [Bacteroidales bacterium]